MTRKHLFLIAAAVLFLRCTTPSYYVKTTPSPKRIYSKIAVIPENFDYWWISSFAYRALITELMDVGFNVIERSNLQAIIDEQKLTASGITHDDSKERMLSHVLDRIKISEYGQMLGVDYLVMVYVVPTGRKVHLGTVRLVEVKTAKVVTSSTFTTQSLGEETDVMMKIVAMDMLNAIRTNDTVIRYESEALTSRRSREKADEEIRKSK